MLVLKKNFTPLEMLFTIFIPWMRMGLLRVDMEKALFAYGEQIIIILLGIQCITYHKVSLLQR